MAERATTRVRQRAPAGASALHRYCMACSGYNIAMLFRVFHTSVCKEDCGKVLHPTRRITSPKTAFSPEFQILMEFWQQLGGETSGNGTEKKCDLIQNCVLDLDLEFGTVPFEAFSICFCVFQVFRRIKFRL